MPIDWTLALIGGVLIGLAATLMLLLKGRIFGVTGIVAGLLKRSSTDTSWRICVVLGLMLGSFIMYLVKPSLFQYEFDTSIPLMALAGFLVGFGTRLGSGCTSGHGVCGLPRLSPRSIVATVTFITSGIVTVYLMGALS